MFVLQGLLNPPGLNICYMNSTFHCIAVCNIDVGGNEAQGSLTLQSSSTSLGQTTTSTPWSNIYLLSTTMTSRMLSRSWLVQQEKETNLEGVETLVKTVYSYTPLQPCTRTSTTHLSIHIMTALSSVTVTLKLILPYKMQLLHRYSLKANSVQKMQQCSSPNQPQIP